MDRNQGEPPTLHPPHPERSSPPPHPPPAAPAPAQSTSSSQRKSSSHIRPIIVLKRRSNPDPTDHSEKTVETTKSYAEMATKAIKPSESVSIFLDPTRYNQLFPSLGAEVVAKVTSSETEPTKLPISTQKMKGHSEDLPAATFNMPNKAQKPKAPFPHGLNPSHGGSKEIRDQYIPKATTRSVSFNGIDNPHFALTQDPVGNEFSSSTPKPRRLNSGYYNPTRAHIEGYNAKLGENKEGHPFHNLSSDPANPGGSRGFTRRHSFYLGRGRGRGRPPTSPGGTPLRGINWRHEHGGKKKGTAEHGGHRISTDELGSPVKESPVSTFGGKNPTWVTPKASDITRPVLEHWTDETSLSSGRGLEEEEELGSHTLPPKGSPEHGYQEEGEPQRPAPKPRTVSVAKVHVPPLSSGSPSVDSPADDTSTSKLHGTRNDLQQLGLQLSVPQPQPPPPPSSPALDTPTPAIKFGNSDYLSPPPPRFQLPPIPSCFQKHLGSANQQTEQTPRPKLSTNEYFGSQGEFTMPQQTTELLSPTSARMERNTVFDNKNTINGADKSADLDEGYEAIGPSKVVQYAPMVQDKASKAFAGHEKVNFGDIDSKRAALAPGQAISGNPAFNPPAGFTDQRTSFVSQSREDRLPPRPAQPPPGLPLPPGLPIPPSYYQQTGINPQTGLGNSSFSQQTGRAAPFAQTIDNRQAAPGQHRRLYPDMGPFTVGQRSDANDSYLGLSVTDSEIKAINETFMKYGRTNEEETPSLTNRYGRRGAVSEQGNSSKSGQPANDFGNRKTTEKDNFKERFEEVFGTKGKVSIEMLQEHQKKRLVAERVRNEKIVAEDEKNVSEPVTGNTGLFPYPAHGKSDTEVTQELLVEAFKQLSSYVEDKITIKDVAGGEKEKPSAYKAGPWKKPLAGKIPDWISDDNTSFFDQSFGKDYVPEGKQTAGGGGPSSKPVIGAVKLEQTAAEGGVSNTRGSLNQSARKDLTTKDEQFVDQVKASNAQDNVIFGPAKPPGYPHHIPHREHLRPLKTFAPFENDQPKVRYGLLPANPRSANTAEKPYINYRGGAVGPVADSAPRYVRGPKGFLELATDMPPPPPADPSPFKQPKDTPSPFAALEQALGTTRFTQGVPERYRLTAPKPPPGAKPTGGLITDTSNGFLRVNYGGRQTQLDPDGRGLSRSEVLKHKQRPGARFGINFNGPNGMEFDIDKMDFNPAEQNALGSKFKLKSKLRREASRDQQSQQPQYPLAGGAQQATLVKGISVQDKGSAAGSGTRSISDIPRGGNPQPGLIAPENWAAQGNPEPKRDGKGWNGGMGGR